MSNSSYTPKSRPQLNFATSELLEGILNGGGAYPPITREAYFTKAREEERNLILDDLPLPLSKHN